MLRAIPAIGSQPQERKKTPRSLGEDDQGKVPRVIVFSFECSLPLCCASQKADSHAKMLGPFPAALILPLA